MTEHAADRVWSGIDVPKTIAGVLAALSAAVIGSFLGVAGTLAGAAVASLIGSVGTEVYHRSINKGKDKLNGTFTSAPAAVGTPPVRAAVSPASDSTGVQRRNIRWKRVALVAGALFVLAMGTLTVAELISGRSIADATRGGNGDRSTVSSLFGDRSGKSDKSDKSTPAPSSSPSSEPTTQPTSDDQPTTQPTSEAPTSQAPAGNTDTGGSTGGTGNTGDTGDSGADSGGGTGGSGVEPQKTGAEGVDTQNPDNGTE